jgi:pimeloyl-ACP methyl ester carboxylesterase
MKGKVFWITGGGVIICLLFLVLLLGKSSKGVRYLFADKQFHYQAFRTLGHAPYGGALPSEVMSLISRITNDENWQREWLAMAEKCEGMAERAADPISKGNALLRASNYYRAAEFFVPPYGEDLKIKTELYQKSVKAFREALPNLGIPHRIYKVPWKKGSMLVYYFPGSRRKPVMLIQGGFDSTNEESYFFAGAALIARGYPVVMFEGPGQSGMIREFGLRFTPQWHEPVGRIIDYMESAEPEIAARKKILVGISLGGLLAGRAAAYEKRIDGVVLFGAPYDMEAAALFQMPSIGGWLFRQDMKGTINMAVNWKRKWDRGLRWGLNNGMWTIGGDTPFDMIKSFGAYTLKDVNDKVLCPVLCIYGEKDIYVSDEKQLDMLKNSFKHATSYTLKIFKEEDGSAEHCQIGATEQAVQEIISWLSDHGMTDIRDNK